MPQVNTVTMPQRQLYERYEPGVTENSVYPQPFAVSSHGNSAMKSYGKPVQAMYGNADQMPQLNRATMPQRQLYERYEPGVTVRKFSLSTIICIFDS